MKTLPHHYDARLTGGPSGYAEVLVGLADGARVVVHPSDALRDGSRVREEGDF